MALCRGRDFQRGGNLADAITLFQRPLSTQRYPFLYAVSVKQMLGGIFLGIVINVGISRRYEKPVVENKESDATREV